MAKGTWQSSNDEKVHKINGPSLLLKAHDKEGIEACFDGTVTDLMQFVATSCALLRKQDGGDTMLVRVLSAVMRETPEQVISFTQSVHGGPGIH